MKKTIIVGRTTNDIPIIQAEKTNCGYRFYCDYCKKYHNHGYGSGHRTAHCFSNSPYIETGYIII